jgi:hypothetical protein
VDFVGTIPLCASGFSQRRSLAHAKSKETCLCNHDSVIDAEPFIRRKNSAASFLCHDTHHLLQAFIAPYTSHDEDFLTSDMGHRPLGNFDKHSKDGLLQGEAQIRWCDDVTTRLMF